MNIFMPDPEPRACARALDDRRLGKMVLETAQIICTALHGVRDLPYKPTHRSHPAVLWAGAAQANTAWLVVLLDELGEEWTWRRRNGQRHKSHAQVHPLVADLATFDGRPVTPWAGCTGAAVGRDVHERYRAYLAEKWGGDRPAPTWWRRGPPAWAALKLEEAA